MTARRSPPKARDNQKKFTISERVALRALQMASREPDWFWALDYHSERVDKAMAYLRRMASRRASSGQPLSVRSGKAGKR